MSVQIELSGQLAVFAGKSVVECAAADSVAQLLAALVESHPALHDALYDDSGVWRRSTLVAVDGEQVLDHDATPVGEDASVLLLMPMAGG